MVRGILLRCRLELLPELLALPLQLHVAHVGDSLLLQRLVLRLHTLEDARVRVQVNLKVQG